MEASEETKQCKVCEKEKLIKCFTRCTSKYKGKTYVSRHNTCSTCKAKGYRQRNPEKQKARMKRYTDENKDKLTAYNRQRSVKQCQRKLVKKQRLLEALGKTTCQDCGYSDPRALSFHHRNPEDKAFNICFALTRTLVPFDGILAEAQKCDILCLNCHQLKHYSV